MLFENGHFANFPYKMSPFSLFMDGFGKIANFFNHKK